MIEKTLVIVDDERYSLMTEIACRVKMLFNPLFYKVVIEKRLSTKRRGVVYFILNPHHKRNRGRRTAHNTYVGWDLTNAISPDDYVSRDFGRLDILAVDNQQKMSLASKKYVTFLLPFMVDMIEHYDIIKDVDVCSIGTKSPARSCFMSRCAEMGYTTLDTHEDYLFGRKRDLLVARSKITVDIPRNQNFIFVPNVRKGIAAANKSLFISCGQYGGSHIVRAGGQEEMLDVVRWFLENAVERCRLVESAYLGLRDLGTMVEHIKALFRKLGYKSD